MASGDYNAQLIVCGVTCHFEYNIIDTIFPPRDWKRDHVPNWCYNKRRGHSALV